MNLKENKQSQERRKKSLSISKVFTSLCLAIYLFTLISTPALARIRTDANNDGVVDGLDYARWRNRLIGGGVGNGPDDGDFNNDGRVDGLDYAAWRNDIGLSCSSQPSTSGYKCFDAESRTAIQACYGRPVSGDCAQWDVNKDHAISLADYDLCATSYPCGGTPTPTLAAPTATPIGPTVTPGGPTLTPTATPEAPTSTPRLPTVTPGGPTLTPTATPGTPTATPEVPTSTPMPPTVTPGGPTLTPTVTPIPPTVTPTSIPGAPVNNVSAPDTATVGTGANPYSVPLTLSASPVPSLFGGAANALKIIGTPTSAQPPASAWTGTCSSSFPTGGNVYCSTTMQTSLNVIFNGSTPGTKYLWVVFHNDIGNTAASYWGASNGWSSPVRTEAITLSAIPTPTVPAAPVNSASAPSTATVGTGVNPYSTTLSLSASPTPALTIGGVTAANVIKVIGTPDTNMPPASAWTGTCSGALPTGGQAYCAPTFAPSLNYIFNGVTPRTVYLWVILHNDAGHTAASYWGASNGWSTPFRTESITLPAVGAPVNNVSAPDTATVGTGANPYSVPLSLSASPAPTLFGGAVNAIKVLGTPTSAQPPASAWAGACSSTLPTGGVVYCSTTMQSSLNYIFNGAIPGTKYLWAIFHNDVGNTAAAYWGTTNGWSVPVRTDAISLGGPTVTPGCGQVAGDPCCPSNTCSTANSLYCGPVGSRVCLRIGDRAADLQTWSDKLFTSDADFDFDNSGTVDGKDYVLWLKAGKTL